jgi:hypothetical protein
MIEYIRIYNAIKKSLIGERISRGNKFIKFFLSLLIVAGLASIVYNIRLLKITFISPSVPLLISFAPGLILSPVLKNQLNRIDGRIAQPFLHYLFHCITTGSLLLSFFLHLNLKFASTSLNQSKISILEKVSYTDKNGNNTKYFKATFRGFEKDFILIKQNESEFNSSKNLIINTKTGLFGYEIIESWKPS